MHFDLAGKVGIVTGTSSGIGAGIAAVLAESGARVIGLSRTGAFKDPSLASHPNLTQVRADLLDPDALAEAVNKAAADRLDFLVNNAGMNIRKKAAEFSDDEFMSIQRLNVLAPFRLAVLCRPGLAKAPDRGRIVNIASVGAHLGIAEVAPYCASKGAVLAMTRSLATEWAGDNINVCSISPGWFPSEMTRQVMDEERIGKILARIPLHAFGDVRDLAAAAAFLVSGAGRYITGQDFVVDGGALAAAY
ncbi:MAG: SDR family oxidoreductase [Planctomycetota bacterium]|nr:SDR family oxidoreductase [Planctomycetota bacterium]